MKANSLNSFYLYKWFYDLLTLLACSIRKHKIIHFLPFFTCKSTTLHSSLAFYSIPNIFFWHSWIPKTRLFVSLRHRSFHSIAHLPFIKALIPNDRALNSNEFMPQKRTPSEGSLYSEWMSVDGSCIKGNTLPYEMRVPKHVSCTDRF